MEIREKRSPVSLAGILGALVWLLVVLPVSVIFFGWVGLFGAILLAVLMRAFMPKKFEVVDPGKNGSDQHPTM